MRRCSRSDRSSRAYATKYAKLLVGQVRLICELAKQNGERYPPNLLHLLICTINRHLSETGGEDALNVLNKVDKRQIKCNVFRMPSVDGEKLNRVLNYIILL